jgi:iron complex outermembrane receptor protein
MKERYTLLVLLLFLLNKGFTQSGNSISGSIQDEQGKHIASATISLLQQKDSSLVKLAVSNENGQYEFVNIKPGRYLLSVVLVGYGKKWSAPFVMNAEAVAVPVIALQASARNMNEVTVTARKPFVETKIDRTVINVEASPTSAGSSALEILEKSPGVSVSNEGNISLRGKAGVIVMLDGKPTYMSATDLANLLRNMPAAELDVVEIMTNPSARYDAAGNSGIINIKTKKGRSNGFNGTLTLGATASLFKPENALYVIPKSQNSFTFNYKHNKVNFFGSYLPNFFRGRQNLSIERNFYDAMGNKDGSSDLVTRFRFGNFNQTLRLGLDYQPNKKNIFGVAMSGFLFEGRPTPTSSSVIKDNNGNILSTLLSNTKNISSFKNFTGNLNWKHNFDSAGKELTTDIDYVLYNNTSDLLLTTDVYNGSGSPVGSSILLNGHLPSIINIWSFKSDYVQPYKGGRFEAGVKSSIVENDNEVNYTRQLPDKSWIPDNRSNHFIYRENINAVYVNANKQLGKWTIQTGLRLENTIAKGRQVSNDSSFKRNFTNLFPSVFISYAFNKQNQLTASYSRRITRPNYQDLNPFTFFLDSLTYRVGNPYLLPQFTHNAELSYAFKSKFIFTLAVNTTNNVISQILRQSSADKITYNTSENIAKFDNVSFSVTAPARFSSWWNANFFATVFNNHYKGIYNTDPIDISFTSFNMNITNSFVLNKTKGWNAELSGFYRYKTVDQLAVFNPVYLMSIGLQKQVMQGKGTFRMNIRDPFAWQKFRATTKYSDVDVKTLAIPDARQVTVTFAYRFGKNTPGSQPRRRTSGSQEEQSRVGGGN